MTDKKNNGDAPAGCKYDVGDIVVYNSFFGKGRVEALVCRVTARNDDFREYDLEAVDGGAQQQGRAGNCPHVAVVAAPNQLGP